MAGEILCIIGEFGSGKSVTANTVMGLLPNVMTIESGRIEFKGESLLELSEAALRKLRGRAVSIIFQDPLSALNPLMTIGEQTREVIDTYGVDPEASHSDKVVEMLSESPTRNSFHVLSLLRDALLWADGGDVDPCLGGGD